MGTAIRNFFFPRLERSAPAILLLAVPFARMITLDHKQPLNWQKAGRGISFPAWLDAN
jgi:hypothetical protein